MNKKILQFIVLISFILITTGLFADPETTNPTTLTSAETASIYSQIDEAYYNWINALETANGDATKVAQLYAPDAIVLGTFFAKPITTNKGINDYYSKLTSVENFRVITTSRSQQIFCDVVISTGLYKFQSTDDQGKITSVPARFILVFKKSGNHWLIVDQHSSIIPVQTSVVPKQ